MTSESIEISRYTYRLAPGCDGPSVIIDLYDARSELVATVLPSPKREEQPAPLRDYGRHVLHYPRSMMPQLIDLLRNEGPVYLIWGDGTEPALSTGFEPVGEGEG